MKRGVGLSGFFTGVLTENGKNIALYFFFLLFVFFFFAISVYTYSTIYIGENL